jgi:hypothetical protein
LAQPAQQEQQQMRGNDFRYRQCTTKTCVAHQDLQVRLRWLHVRMTRKGVNWFFQGRCLYLGQSCFHSYEYLVSWYSAGTTTVKSITPVPVYANTVKPSLRGPRNLSSRTCFYIGGTQKVPIKWSFYAPYVCVVCILHQKIEIHTILPVQFFWESVKYLLSSDFL